jgi:hypothetical protein
VQSIAEQYFLVIHRWLAFISRKTFFTYLVNPLAQRRTEQALLVLSMKISQVLPEEADFDATYRVAKRFHNDVESSGVLSIQVLQANLLIALYEIGHAIYPAAYLTIGQCARYGLALGIDKLGRFSPTDEPCITGSRSWNEVEEGRRVWWTILELDRFLAFSNPTRPLSTQDATFNTFLPVDDAAWDDDTAKPSDAVRVCDASTMRTGNSARLAQTTYLLSQALTAIKMSSICTINPDKTQNLSEETAQLRRTLLALVHAADSEGEHRRLEFCPQSALAFSTILLLEQHRMAAREPDAVLTPSSMDAAVSQPPIDSLWTESINACDRLVPAAMSWMTLCPVHPFATRSLPIFTLLLTYQVASVLLRLSRGSPEGDAREKLDTCRRFLEMADGRWKLAGTSLCGHIAF